MSAILSFACGVVLGVLACFFVGIAPTHGGDE